MSMASWLRLKLAKGLVIKELTYLSMLFLIYSCRFSNSVFCYCFIVSRMSQLAANAPVSKLPGFSTSNAVCLCW